MTKDIAFWEKEIIKKNYSKAQIKDVLDHTLEKISFLEEVYRTGGKYNVYSAEFSDAAYQERQNLCQLSSACFNILNKSNN